VSKQVSTTHPLTQKVTPDYNKFELKSDTTHYSDSKLKTPRMFLNLVHIYEVCRWKLRPT